MNKYDAFLKELNIEINLKNLNDSEKVASLLTKINTNRLIISKKIENGENLSFEEQKLYYNNIEKSNHNLLIKSNLFNDFVFRMIYNIYLTDINAEIEEMSKLHSNNIPIRTFYGIDLSPTEVVAFLKKYAIGFAKDVLDNDNLYKENNLLKNAIKREYKKAVKQIKKEAIAIENETFEQQLFAIKIYFDVVEMDFRTEIISFNQIDFNLDIDFFVHIAFGHYYHILKTSKRYTEKDHFTENEYENWCNILFDLSCYFGYAKLSLENNNKIDFITNNKYYRLTLDKQVQKVTSLFPLKDSEVAGLDKSRVLTVD